jgi:hypothetical protein
MAAMKRFVCVLLMLPATPSHAQTQRSAHAFIDHVYARYAADRTGDADFVLGKDASRIFSPSLLTLVKRDQERAGQGYVGKLDFDPVCDCQDPEGMRVVSVNVSSTSPKRAISVVHLDFGGGQETYVRLQLTYLPLGWRIVDISTADMGSLRKLLQ